LASFSTLLEATWRGSCKNNDWSHVFTICTNFYFPFKSCYNDVPICKVP